MFFLLLFLFLFLFLFLTPFLFLTFMGGSHLHYGGYHLVFSDDQVESRLWWVAGRSSHTFAAESPDECARAVMGVTPQSGLLSLLSSSQFF